jgi:hypothetical protein
VRRGRTLAIVGGTIALLSVVLGVVAVVSILNFGVRSAAELARLPVRSTPFEGQVSLRAGTWVVYEQGVGCDRSGENCEAPTLRPEQVRVRTTDARGVAVRDASPTISMSSIDYFVPVARFDVEQEGTYEVTVASTSETTFRLAPYYTNDPSTVRWLLAGLGAGLALAVGLTLLGVGLVLQARARSRGLTVTAGEGAGSAPAAAPIRQGALMQHEMPAQAPPGWYPDPQYPNVLRWWSGHAWTEHTSSPGSRPSLRE